MRYHWSLAIGYLHAHQAASTSSTVYTEPSEIEDGQYADLVPGKNHVHTPGLDDAGGTRESDDSELGLNKHDLEGWQDVESVTNGGGNDEESDLEDSEEDFIEM